MYLTMNHRHIEMLNIDGLAARMRYNLDKTALRYYVM